MSNKKDDPRGGEGSEGEKDGFLRGSSPHHASHASPLSKLDNNAGACILAYCLASISMTVVNKYVVSGSYWNLNFLYLAIQVNSLVIFSWHVSDLAAVHCLRSSNHGLQECRLDHQLGCI